jgi:exodeoxyribonuclease V beta subunit
MSMLAPLEVESAPLAGVTLIEASAGTGKTHTIASLFLRLLLETDLMLSEILVVTYTRAATAELRLRIRARLGQALEVFEGACGAGDDPVLACLVERAREKAQTAHCRGRLVDALRAFDEAAIFTIHGFCQRVLKRHAFESGMAFESELREDQSLLVEEVVCDFWADRLSAASQQFVAALASNDVTIDSLVRLVKRAASSPDLVVIPAAHPEPIERLERAYADAGATVAALWAQHATEIERVLAQRGLNGNIYGPGKMRGMFSDVLPRAASFSASDLPDRIKYLTPAGMKCNKDYVAPKHAFFDACGHWWTACCNLRTALQQHVIAFQHDVLEFARRELARRSDEAGSLGFDDLLLRLSAALDSAVGDELIRSIRTTHKAALIDEFQDTDPVQCDVFRRIYAAHLPGQAPGSLFLIGDPKQAIYAFRGADVFAYIAAARSAVDRAYTLSTNYRSDPSLVRGIDSLFARAHAPFLFPEISYRPVTAAPAARDRLQGAGAAFEILFMADGDDKPLTKAQAEVLVPKQLAVEIVRLLASGARLDGAELEPRQIAVLCRTNLQARSVQNALREVGIPAVLDGDASVFDSSMADELARWLWAMVEPGDGARVRAALATTGIGVTADELLALEHDERGWDSWVGRFHALQELWHARGCMRALHTLCDDLGVAPRLLALLDGERRYTDLMHLAELLHAEALHSRKGPRALLDWYRRMRAGEAQRVGMALQDVQIRLESDARAVTLTTIHKSKGLQFPIVYCPFVWDGTLLRKAEQNSPQFHDRAHDDRLTLVLRRDENDSAQLEAAEDEALAENLRLLYVALTRAKHRLSVVWGRLGKFESSALAYLLHQPSAAGVDSLRKRTAERVKQLTQAELQADLARLTAVAEGAIDVRALAQPEAAVQYVAQREHPFALAARTASRRAVDTLQISSFSRLVAGDRAGVPGVEPVGLDRDELSDAPAVEPLDGVVPNRVPLADFPAGASFGHLIHAIYETLDFQVAAPQALYAGVETALHDYGAPAVWKEPLARAVFDTLYTPLAVTDMGLPKLASVALDRRLCELEFLFPVADASHPEQPALLSAERLGRALLAHARDAHERDYASRLAKLRFVPFAGFLRGFMDLVVEHAGRFYVLDYKSNHLGSIAPDYHAGRLGTVMRRHHYVLQYLVYTLALHRYLTLRLPGYRYDDHFGGVYYLFVRGMHPEHAPGTGVFFDRPDQGLIQRLSSLLSDPGQKP